MDQTSNHKKTPWIIAAISVTILVVVIFLFRTAIYQEFNNLKLVPEPETFTELYFNNPNNLPKVAVKGEKEIFSFTIHNLEGVKTLYPYSVYFLSQNGVRTIFAKGNVVINNGDSDSITVPYVFASSDEKGMVVVMLTSLNQQIDFLIPDTN